MEDSAEKEFEQGGRRLGILVVGSETGLGNAVALSDLVEGELAGVTDAAAGRRRDEVSAQPLLEVDQLGPLLGRCLHCSRVWLLAERCSGAGRALWACASRRSVLDGQVSVTRLATRHER